MEFVIFLGLMVLAKSQMIYPDQYAYMRSWNNPISANNQQQLYQPSYGPVAYAAPIPAVSQGPYYSTYAPQPQPQQQAVAYSVSQPGQAAYYPPQVGQAAYYAPQAEQSAYVAPATYSLQQSTGQQKRDSLTAAASEINVNVVPAQQLSPLAQTLPADWAYRVNDIISKGVTKLAINIQNVIYSNNLVSATNEKDNIVFSPLNIAGALAMIHLGSAGITFDETSRILGLATGVDISTHSELVHQMFGLLMSVIHQKIAGSSRTIDIANGLFLQEGYSIRPQFKTISENVYRSEIVNLDFRLKGKEAQDRINEWVKEKTKGKISTILNEQPPASTNIIIASALYFNAEWNRFFIKGATNRRPFFIEPNQQILVDLMYNAGNFPFYEDQNIGVKIVGLPYKGLDTTMYIMLPSIEGATALGEFEKTLTPEIIEYLIQNMKNQSTIIGMPKMKITSSMKLKKVLQSLGLKSLFDPATSDLSLLSPGPGERNNLVGNAATNEAVNPDSYTPAKRVDSRESNNKDQLIFSRFGGGNDGGSAGFESGQNNRKNLFQYTDNNNNYNIEQWSTGFHIRRLQKKRREIDDNEHIKNSKNLKRIPRQAQISEDFLRVIENRNFRTFGLDNLRNSGSLSNPHLFADEVLHKVDIDINEKGTEAAAATAIVIERDGRQKRFIAKRPFLFFIRHNPTKLILFWGTINTPLPNYPNA